MTPEQQAVIVEACQAHKTAHWRDDNYRAAICIGTDYFVKFGAPRTLGPEIAAQNYISAHAEAHPGMPGMPVPRIPKVLFHFQDQHTVYMVTEYIKLADSPLDVVQRTAVALRWLSEVPLPRNHVIGPLASGRIRHRFFKNYRAPLDFSSVGALERYIEKGRTMLSTQAQQRVQPVSFSGERSTFMQPDMDPSNFGVDERGNTVIMDFAEICPLPQSFATFTMASNTSLAPIAELLGLSSNSNAASMAVISSVLWMTADAKLGLNNDGYPKTSKP